MKNLNRLYLLSYIFLNVLSSFFLKIGLNANKLLFLISGGLLYFFSLLSFLQVIKRIPISLIYPISIGTSIILITLGEKVFLNETLTIHQLMAIGVISLGILLIFKKSISTQTEVAR